MSTHRIDTLVEGLGERDILSLARLISWAENRDPRIDEVIRRIYPRTGQAHRLGITGPPGSGKSTLIARLSVALKNRGERVAVVAIDPTSPYSGGALLGDRYRMTEMSEDPEIFMRSMATRGSLGGLASATESALDLLDAAGFTYLIVETVGVGQVEFDIAKATDTVTVVLVPESGDGIQAMKAGLMEISDLFVINKADREGASRIAGDLESMLGLRSRRDDWRPEVLQTVAHTGLGVEDLLEAVDRHRTHMESTGALTERRRQTLELRLFGEARQKFLDRFETAAGGFEDLLDRVERREMTPQDAATDMVNRLTGTPGSASPDPDRPQ